MRNRPKGPLLGIRIRDSKEDHNLRPNEGPNHGLHSGTLTGPGPKTLSRGTPIGGPNPVTTMGREPNWGPQSGTIIRDPNQRPQKVLVTPRGPQLIGWHQLGTLSGTLSMDHKNWLQKVPILETPIGDLRPQKVHQGKPQKGWMDVYIDGWMDTNKAHGGPWLVWVDMHWVASEKTIEGSLY